MLAAIDKGDRDLLGILRHQLCVGGYVPFGIYLTNLGADGLDHGASLIAQVAAGFRKQQDARASHAGGRCVGDPVLFILFPS